MAYFPSVAISSTPDVSSSGSLTAADAVVGAPTGTGTLLTGASTAGSTLQLACPGGDSSWDIQLSGVWVGTVVFEASFDGGVNWINVNGRQTGVVNTVLTYSFTTNGLFRGNTSGATHIRARCVALTSGTVAVAIRISAGVGAIFLNASIPAGSNMIGGIQLVDSGGSNKVAINAAGQLSTSGGADVIASGNITTQNLNPNSGTATAASTISTGNLNSSSTATIQVTGVYTGALTPQATVDGTNWVNLAPTALINVATGVYSGTVPSAATGIYQLDVSGFKQFRLSALAAVTGTAVVSVQVSNGAGALAIDNPLPPGTNTIGGVGYANVVSAGNSTTAQLAANATFTGVWDDVLPYGVVEIVVFSDQPSANNGLVAQWSTNNGTSIDDTETWSVPASNGYGFAFPPEARYFRVLYTNGAGGTTTTLKIQTVYKVNAAVYNLLRSRQSVPAAAVSDGQRIAAWGDQSGRQVVAHNTPRALAVRNSGTLTTTGVTTLLAASGVAGQFVDLLLIILTNTSAVAVRATISDGTAVFDVAIAANGGAVIPFNTPLPQTTANTAWTITLSAAVTDIRFFAQGMKTV